MKHRTRFEIAVACALLLAPAGIVRAQEVFSGSYSAETANDSFSASCISAQKPNIWKQLGINPLTCQPQTMGQDASGQCTLKGATVVAHQGGVCYYCEALNPPGQLYIPYDQVQAVSVRGYSCGASPVDPGCMAVCRQQPTTTTTTEVPKTTGGGGIPEQGTPETNQTRRYPIDTSTTSFNQPCQPPPADEPPAAPSYRYQAGFQAGFNECKVTPTIVGDVGAAAFGSVYNAIPGLLEISASPKTLQSVIHPAGTSTNANPYLEGETDGGRLCTWLLKNEAGWVTECPGGSPSQEQGFGSPLPCNQQDSYADNPAAAPNLRYTLGFENGVKNCALSQLTVQNIATAAIAMRFQVVAQLLTIAATPTVIQNVLHPPGSSTNPNPYLRGTDEGARLCQWAIAVSPGFLRKCPAATVPAVPRAAPTTATKCTSSQLAAGLNQAIGMTGTYIQRRFDCFLCTNAWLTGKPYTPPANGGKGQTLAAIQTAFASLYAGKTVLQGPSLSCERQAAQAAGKVTPSSQAQITAEMEAAGPGAKAFIFVTEDPTLSSGHVFGAETVDTIKGPQVEYWDPQQEMSGDLWFKPGLWVGFYRIQ